MTMDVLFEVSGLVYRLPEAQATILAETLRWKSTEFLDGEGVEGAGALAAIIEDVLVGNRDAELPIPLEGEAAEAVFYILNTSDTPTELYRAVAEIHKRRLEQERGH